jgi:GNAT superfamily N-acetyltransferase
LIELAGVPAAEVRPLRAELLRPGQAPEQLVYPGDEDPGALHLIALAAGKQGPVGIASVMADPHPRTPAYGDWRVRGMATLPECRGRGVGAALLARCEAHATEQGGRRLWCNARVPALGFYERAGWSVESEVFEIEQIGPHAIMSKPLA